MTNGRKRLVVTILVFAAFIAAAAYVSFGHRAPAGQPPLRNLTAQSLDELRTEFNGAANQTRLVVLLSPT